MPKGSLVMFIVHAIICGIAGFLSNGEGSESARLGGISGGAAIVAGIVCIGLCIAWHYWIGIAVTIAIYFVMLNIGGAIMRNWIRHLRR